MPALTDTRWNMKPNIPLAKQLAKRDLPALVYDAVNLEGVAMTLPEVQTILDGITVGGIASVIKIWPLIRLKHGRSFLTGSAKVTLRKRCTNPTVTA
ncbi:hypothetical protein [Vreelandella azerica]|uniref:hypothetical protein n=1 Tax=Vreelandella azerica TaxID=2732867 RepID=UPI001C11E497|nr:hypothetical protein [Halomonas azerica]